MAGVLRAFRSHPVRRHRPLFIPSPKRKRRQLASLTLRARTRLSNQLAHPDCLGNKGAQNYELPEKVDLDKYGVVSIWCNRFTVNFAAAPLTAAK